MGKYLLYKKVPYAESVKCYFYNFKIVEFSPKFSKLYFEKEKRNFRDTIVRIMFGIFSRWRYKIFLVVDKKNDNTVCHSSFLIPKIFKFPFLNAKDYEIGPCYTVPEYRGKGIYPKVLDYVTSLSGGGATWL